jgi:MoxR-like ATPase
MLVSFKSTAAAEIIMYKEHIAAVLELLGKDIERGVITAAETTSAIQKIEALIEADKKQRQLLESAEDSDADEDLDSIEKKKKNDVVTLSARLFPFLDMLRAANKKQKDVLWGI